MPGAPSWRSTRIRWKRSCWRSSSRFQGKTCSRVQTTGPGSSSGSPHSSASSRVSAARSDSPGSTPPPGVAHQALVADRVLEAEEEHAVVGVDDERAHSGTRHRLEPVVERAEPEEPLAEGDGSVRGRGRGEDEERGLHERAQLRPELGPLAEGAAVGLLADEGERERPQLAREPGEPAGVEVAAVQVAGAGRRAVGGVRDAVAELEELELRRRVDQPRREAGVVQQPPEVVARIGEVGVGLCRDTAGVDAAEDAAEAGREDVGNARGGCGHAADSVAHARPRSRCSSMRSAAAPAAGPASAARSAGARPSWRRRASSRLPAVARVDRGAALGLALPGRLLERLSRDDADGLVASAAVAAGVALSFGQRPQPHCGPL